MASSENLYLISTIITIVIWLLIEFSENLYLISTIITSVIWLLIEYVIIEIKYDDDEVYTRLCVL